MSCSTQKQRSKQAFKDSKADKDTIRIANDSLEYEIIIIEPGFNIWLASQRPRGYYDKIYLRQRNKLFVLNYNIRANTPSQFSYDLYPQQINYDWAIDYGYEVNYLLYNYFIYFQEEYNQRLR
jgi:hypothetical protein